MTGAARVEGGRKEKEELPLAVVITNTEIFYLFHIIAS
jgi:hypothetical protein